MLYLISTREEGVHSRIYCLFETHTESIIECREPAVVRLVNRCNMETVNIKIIDDKVKVKTWPNDIEKQYIKNITYILMGKVNEQRFKLIRLDNKIIYMDEIRLKQYIESNNIINCSFKNGEYKSIDTYNTSIDDKFRQYIDKEYNKFIAKTALVGRQISFDYSIENTEVKITKYTGKDKRVIIPNFITTVNEGAFSNKGIEELILNDGLKYIGSKAFTYNTLKYVQIPKTVEFIGIGAFRGNNGITSVTGGYTDALEKLNEDTKLL